METTTYPLSPEPPRSSVPPFPPSTEENIIYVPNTLEGQITLTNLEFLNEYNDHESPIYESLTRELEENIKDSLTSRNGGDRDEIFVKVMNLKSGSVVVDYRVTWPNNIEEAPLDAETMNDRLTNYLGQNSNYLASYLVPANTIRVARLPDTCAMDTINME